MRILGFKRERQGWRRSGVPVLCLSVCLLGILVDDRQRRRIRHDVDAFQPSRLLVSRHQHLHPHPHHSHRSNPTDLLPKLAYLQRPTHTTQQPQTGLSAVPVETVAAAITTATDITNSATTTTTTLIGSNVFDTMLNIWQSEDKQYLYAFMLPVTTCVAILCQLAGIGGAALLGPVFLLIFPLLGPDYMLPSAASAISSALLTECFGFASGLSGYWRRGLIDWSSASLFWRLAIPASLIGALVEPSLASNKTILRAVYATLMISLAIFLLVSDPPTELPEDCPVPDDDSEEDTLRSKTATDGTVYRYFSPSNTQSWKTMSATTFGASLTGLLGIGIGEVIFPQLVRVACMPVPVAAGTSVAVVVFTALTAALVQFIALAHDVTTSNPDLTFQGALIQVVPWSLVQYTIPGAVLGGQIAPWIAANRWIDDETVENAVSVLFAVIGVAFAAKTVIG